MPALNPSDNAMVKYLWEQKDSINTLEELYRVVKKSPIKEKRFHAMHAYSRVILDDWVKTDPAVAFQMIRRLVVRFETLEVRFQQRYPGKPFVNYKYLLHLLFNQCGLTQFLKYIPTMKCKRRRKYYTELVRTLGIHVDGE